MKILVTSNHGNTLNPKEGADIRKNKLITSLAQKNDVILLESDRYLLDQSKNRINVTVEYYHEYKFFGRPLSFLLDFNPSFVSKLNNILKKENIDIIQVSFPYGLVATKLLLCWLNKKAIIVYDAHNVEGDVVEQAQISHRKPLVHLFLSIYITFLEWLAVKTSVDYIISVSGDDQRRFVEKYGLNEKQIKVVPSGTTIRIKDRNYNKEKLKAEMGIFNAKVILFHGTYVYSPNREAFELITNYISPNIKAGADNVLFLLAGNGVPVFERDNIRSLGFIEDIDSLLHAADIAIVPLLRGGGTKLKTLDYLGAGLPIVTTKKGIEGIDAIDGKDAIIIDGVNEGFIEAIRCLLHDEDLCNSLSLNGQKLAKEEYDWQKIGENLNVHYNRVIEAADKHSQYSNCEI